MTARKFKRIGQHANKGKHQMNVGGVIRMSTSNKNPRRTAKEMFSRPLPDVRG